MCMKHICELAYQFLINHLPSDISEESLQAYFVGDDSSYSNLTDIFERLVISAQNYQSMPNGSGYSAYRNKTWIKAIICVLILIKFLKITP